MRKPVDPHEAIGPKRRWLGSRTSGRRLHAGVDLVARGGTPVHAPEAGRVVLVARASYGADGTPDAEGPTEAIRAQRRALPRFSTPPGWAGYGPELLVIQGDSGRFHLLAHVADVGVTVGQFVAEGEVVAVVAPRGRHVHWEVRDRLRPPAGWATVEITEDPIAWLAGEVRRYLDLDPPVCPARPGRNLKTPRRCRPASKPRSVRR